MCCRRKGGCRMPDWLRDYEARLCSIMAILSFSFAVTSFALFTDSAVLSLTISLKPAMCTVVNSEKQYGLTKCNWTSCRSSCTAMFYNCTQIKVVYMLEHNNSSTNSSNTDDVGTNHLHEYSNVGGSSSNMVMQSGKFLRGTQFILKRNKRSFEQTRTENASLFSENDTVLYNAMTVNDSGNASSFIRSNLYFINDSRTFSTYNESEFSNVTQEYLSSSNNESESNETINILNDSDEEEKYSELYEDSVFLSASNGSLENASSIPLYVNIFGCGYEPEKLCERFYENYTHVGMEFQCLINFQDEIFAVPDPENYDFTKLKDPMRSLLLSLIPLGLCIFSSLWIKVRGLCQMRPKIPEERPKRRRALPKKVPQGDNSDLPSNVGSRSTTKLSNHKNEQTPAFIKVVTPVPAPVDTRPIDREQFF